MISANGALQIGNFTVNTVSGRGFTAEEMAEQILNKIIHVGGNAHPVIREQAEAF